MNSHIFDTFFVYTLQCKSVERDSVLSKMCQVYTNKIRKLNNLVLIIFFLKTLVYLSNVYKCIIVLSSLHQRCLRMLGGILYGFVLWCEGVDGCWIFICVQKCRIVTYIKIPIVKKDTCGKDVHILKYVCCFFER